MLRKSSTMLNWKILLLRFRIKPGNKPPLLKQRLLIFPSKRRQKKQSLKTRLKRKRQLWKLRLKRKQQRKRKSRWRAFTDSEKTVEEVLDPLKEKLPGINMRQRIWRLRQRTDAPRCLDEQRRRMREISIDRFIASKLNIISAGPSQFYRAELPWIYYINNSAFGGIL